MREIRFNANTEFSVTTMAIRHSPAHCTARLELTLPAKSLGFTFRDSAALIVFVNALTQLAFDADDPDHPRTKIRARVFARTHPLGSPGPGADQSTTGEVF